VGSPLGTLVGLTKKKLENPSTPKFERLIKLAKSLDATKVIIIASVGVDDGNSLVRPVARVLQRNIELQMPNA
jgi:hypothetical protein